ncbi:MAG TPA: hypothetical protein VFL14_12460, partial [Xanthomonadales bacterium]|nr:hypothetical protein [Xanthomonadales bacterium]
MNSDKPQNAASQPSSIASKTPAQYPSSARPPTTGPQRPASGNDGAGAATAEPTADQVRND